MRSNCRSALTHTAEIGRAICLTIAEGLHALAELLGATITGRASGAGGRARDDRGGLSQEPVVPVASGVA
jgi:hypothetical protein